MNKRMRSVFLVRSEHLNHQGHLFGGDLMAEIDTVAYCLLRELFGELAFVTRAAEIRFDRPARLGDAIAFEAALAKIGHTSVTVDVTGKVRRQQICGARMVYVNIGPDGLKAPVPRRKRPGRKRRVSSVGAEPRLGHPG
jgi:acyl-CoA hydrolase